MKFNKFLQSEKLKREKAKDIKRYAHINWNIKKIQIYDIFNEVFNEFDIDGKEFYIDKSLNDELSSKRFIGYDCVQVTHPTRLTGNVVITKENNSTEFDRKMEVGSALSITCSKVGSFNVFLIPSKNDDRLIKTKSILLFSTNNPNDFTKKLILVFIKRFLVFQRVDSLFENASISERLYIHWLYFIDIRNREKRRSLTFKILNHWGAVAITALATWLIA